MMPRTYTVIMGSVVIGSCEFPTALNPGEYVVIDGCYHPVIETSRAHHQDGSEMEYVVRLGTPYANAESR